MATSSDASGGGAGQLVVAVPRAAVETEVPGVRAQGTVPHPARPDQAGTAASTDRGRPRSLAPPPAVEVEQPVAGRQTWAARSGAAAWRRGVPPVPVLACVRRPPTRAAGGCAGRARGATDKRAGCCVAGGLVVGPVGELPVFFGEHLQLGPAPAGCPDLPGADGQDKDVGRERIEEAGVFGPDAYGEAAPVGEPEDGSAMAVALNTGNATVDGHRVPGLGSTGQARVQPRMAASLSSHWAPEVSVGGRPATNAAMSV